MIKLNDKLNVDEDQKTEITNMLFTFLKLISEEKNIEAVSAPIITSWWLKMVDKPSWIDEKLKKDVEFVANICEFIETYKNTIRVQPVDMYPIKFKTPGSDSGSTTFLMELAKSKGVDCSGFENLSSKEALDKIDQLFYPNNQCDTLGEFPA